MSDSSLDAPWVSIVIPSYNAAGTVAETLGSLQAIEHGWESVREVIVCDDCSTDDSLDAIYAASFDRCPLIVLRHEVNQGEAVCYRTMLARMSPTVEWFIILHADDRALPNLLTRTQALIGECTPDVAAVSSNFFVDDGARIDLSSPEMDLVLWGSRTSADARSTAQTGSWWHISGALVRRAAWEAIGGRNSTLPYSGDWEMVLKWQLAGYTVGHSLIPTTVYRQETGRSVSSRSYLEFLDLHEQCAVAESLPDVFSGQVRLRFAVRMLKEAVRRTIKFGLAGDARRAGMGVCVMARTVRLLARLASSRP